MRPKGSIVQPFNDVYTHDCFMNSLLCAARHYQLDYPILTLHRIFYYSMEGKQLVGSSEISFSIKALAGAAGLIISKENDHVEDWKEQYGTAFKRGDLILVQHDDFYNPLRVDTYNKDHLPHYTLIYDMDNKNETLSVIESRYRKTVSYKNMKMQYKDYVKSRFQEKNLTKYILRKGRNTSEYPYKKLYLDRHVKLEEPSITNLGRYICYLSKNKIMTDNSIMDHFNDICNQVKIERYQYEQVFCNQDLSYISDEIYKNWYLIRTYVVKLSMLDQAEMIQSKMVTGLRKIKELEEEKLRVLCFL